MEISFNTKTALSIMACNFGLEITKELNDHIESVIIPQNIDASNNLVGQINRNEDSAQLIFPHDDDDVGEEFSEYLCRLANQYMDYVESDAVTDGSGEVNRSVTGNEKKYSLVMAAQEAAIHLLLVLLVWLMDILVSLGVITAPLI